MQKLNPANCGVLFINNFKLKKAYAIITAGGTGSRFKSSAKPKQYVTLNGKPVILYSMLVFQKCKEINEIIISADKQYFDYLHNLAVKNKITKLTRLVEGGKSRFQSVKNAFRSIEGAAKNDIVLIHDAARPNIDAKLVNGLLSHSSEVITGCRITETIKKDKNGYVKETVSRENLWTVQTPQAFRYGVLENSYKKCGKKNDFTDESALVEHAGYKVKLIEGSRNNIKLTTPDDLALLKKLMS